MVKVNWNIDFTGEVVYILSNFGSSYVSVFYIVNT